MKRKIWKQAPLILLVIGSQCFGFGIDKLSAELDVSKGFKSVDTLVVFNDDAQQTIFVTARPLKWEMGSNGEFKTEPSMDLSIYPSVQKIRPGESAPFKIRYKGEPVQTEASYRVFFSQIRLPNGKAIPDGDVSKTSETVDQSLLVGLGMTVPVYVSDFSVKSDVLKQVNARVESKDGKTLLHIVNHGNRHITIKSYRINGIDKSGLGVVLAGKERIFPIEIAEPVTKLELNVVARGQSGTISANEVQ